MRNILFLLVATALIAASCSTDNKPVDPTMMLNSRYTGITFTDETGTIIGPVDLDDWNLYPGDIAMWALAKPVSSDDEKKILPDGYGVGAAYPNPFNGSISLLRIMTPAATPIEIRIVNQDGQVVFSDDLYLEAGAHEYTWSPGIAWQNPEGGSRVEYPDGIYRVYYSIDIPGGGPYSGYGDIWLTHTEPWWWGDR